jgi:hypothetical protein
MHSKKDSLSNILGVVMIIAGALGGVGWASLFVFGIVLNGGEFAGFDNLELELIIPVWIGFVGAGLSLITGVFVVFKKNLWGWLKTSLAVGTSLIYLPCIILLSMQWWFFVSIPAILLGFIPPAVYVVKAMVDYK